MSITLQLPKLTDLRPRITVVGVGGAGCNAVNNMIAAGLTGVEFVVANTDAQALVASSAEHRLQLGVNLTEGLGAGSKPEIGEAAAEEAVDEIRAQISGSHMVFIAAGMGGGTGTGACAVIARVARELGILTVGVVTKPFMFEGTRRLRTAEAGVVELKKHVDTLIVIPNQNLFRVANEKTTFAEAFVLADQVLYSGVACIVDLILKDGLINLDFADVRTVMKDMGAAMMGTGEAVGERRAVLAAEEAIANPLLDDVTLKGARGLLLSITGSHDMTLYEVDEAASRVRQEVDPEANIIVGATFDDSLGEAMRVSIVASGMERMEKAQVPPPPPEAWPNTRIVQPQGAAHDGGRAPTETYEQRLSAAVGAAGLPQPPPVPGGKETAAASAPGGEKPASQPQPSRGSAPPVPRETWQAPGNVLIERAYQPHPTGAMPPPPVPSDPAAFRPQPPSEVRRPQTRRIPEVEDFPVVGQRAYYGGSGTEADRGRAKQAESGGRIDNLQHAGAGERRRPGFLERITGRRRKGSDSHSSGVENVSERNEYAAHGRVQNDGASGSSSRQGPAHEIDSPEDPVDLPMFFGKNRR
ncbi:MAG TPA: cell division protein FtsZ [Hyphomicrobiaceae bacterium]|nr:cell division protein FtsZ [Hyphomicrobiaceae bacterium]